MNKCDIFSILIFVGMISCIISIIILLHSKNRADFILTLFLTCALAQIFVGFYYRTGLYLLFPHATQVNTPLVFLISPLMYMYIKKFVTKQKIITEKFYLHFIPFLLMFLFLLPLYSSLEEYKIFHINQVIFHKNQNTMQSVVKLLFPVIIEIQFLIYFILTRRLIKKSAASSETVKHNKLWLSFFLYINTFYFFILFILRIINVLSGMYNNLFLIMLGLFPSIICYFIIIQKLHHRFIIYNINIKKNDSSKKHNKKESNISKEKKYLKQLDEIIINNKLYTNLELSLNDLADLLSVSNNYLSTLLNNQTGLNFYGYINRHRINEAKKYIQNKTRHSFNLLSIAYECGFNSKATFNRAFKKFTNMTPSEYKNKCQNFNNTQQEKTLIFN